MAESQVSLHEQEAGSEGLVDDDKKTTAKAEAVLNGDDTVSEHSNTSSCGEPSLSLRVHLIESASLSDSNSRASDVQAQIKQRLRGLSPVKKRPDSNASDTKRSKQRNRISQMISGGSYRSKRELFNKLFILNRGLPHDEQLITDFSCALQRDILVHGRLYLSQNWMCFYANIIGWETLVTINWGDITAITKEKTARVIPNAIQVNTSTEKHFFTSFVSRENSYRSLFRIWQNSLMGQPTSPQHLRSLCKRIRGQTGSRDETDFAANQEQDQVEAEETGDEVTENDTGQDDDQSFTASENSQEVGHEQSITAMEHQDSPSSTKISVIPPSPTSDHIALDERPGVASVPSVTRSPSTCEAKESESKEEAATLPARPVSPLARRAEHLMSFARRKKPEKKRLKKKTSARTLMHLASVSLPVPDHDAEESTEMEEEGSLSSEDDQGDAICPCLDDHPGKLYVSEEFNFDIDALYEHLFAEDSDLMKNLYKERKMFDFKYGPMERDESGGSFRIITYILTLNYTIGPKHSPTKMKQIFHKENSPGSFYVVDTEVRNQGIPYSESFYVHNRYCLTRLYGNRSRMIVHGQVVQTKNVMGFMKNMILRSADEALVDYCKDLALCLRQRSDLLPRDPGRKSSAISRKEPNVDVSRVEAAASRSSLGSSEPSVSAIPPCEIEKQRTLISSLIAPRMPVITALVLLMLLFLLAMNTYLFYQVYNLGHLVRNDRSCTQRPLPTSQDEWYKILQHQKQAYGVEVKRLKDAIGGTAQLVKQVEKSISELYNELEQSYAASEVQDADKANCLGKSIASPRVSE